MEFINQNTIKLCRQGSCCPTVEKTSENEFIVKDDYDGSVKLTSEEIDDLYEAYQKLKA